MHSTNITTYDDPDTSTDGVKLCDGQSGGGSCQTYTYPGNNNTCIALGTLDNKAESLYFQGSYVGGQGPGQYQAIMYDDTNCQVYNARYDSNQSSFGALNNVFSSMRIEKNPPPPDCTPPSDGVVLYEEAGYGGRCEPFTEGGWAIQLIGGKASSLRFFGSYVGQYRVTLFNEPNLTDALGTFTSDVADFSMVTRLNDQADGIRVERIAPLCTPGSNGVVLYEEPQYGGRCETFGEGDSAIQVIGGKVSSLRFVGSYVGQYRVTLFNHPNMTDPRGTFTSDVPDFSAYTGLNEEVDGIRVERIPPPCTPGSDGVVLYEHTWYMGACQTFTEGDFVISAIPGKASSLRFFGSYVGQYEVTLFNEPTFTDPLGVFSGDVADFNAYTRLNDQADGIRVRRRGLPPPVLKSPLSTTLFDDGQDITISWDAVPRADDYEFELWSPNLERISLVVTGTSMPLGPLSPDTYSWRVRARAGSVVSDWSATWTFTVRPAPPRNLRVRWDCGQVTLAWDASTSTVDGYRVKRDTNQPVDIGNRLDYTDTGLTGGLLYTYLVKAVRNGVESASEIASVVAGTCTLGVSPASLDFGDQPVGTTSAPKRVTLTNTGNLDVTISNITASGDFARSNSCPISPSTLAKGASCTIDVTFTPTATGNRTGALTITSNASGSPHVASLSGNGTTSPSKSLTLIVGAGGSVTVSPPGASYAPGTHVLSYPSDTSITLVAKPDPCYAFVSWVENGVIQGTAPGYGIGLNVDHTVTANFAPISAPRETRDPNRWFAQYFGDDRLSGSPCAEVNESGEFIDHEWYGNSPGWGLPADRFSTRFQRTVNFPCGSYRFDLFYDDGVRFYVDGALKHEDWTIGRRSFSVTMPLAAGNHDLKLEHYENDGWAAVKLNWTKVSDCGYTLSLSSTTGGSAGASPSGPTYAAGTVVTLTATASSGYTFTGWTVDGAPGGSASLRTITMDSNHTVVANFASEPRTYRLTLPVTTGCTVNASPPSPTYPAGTSVTLIATAASGYTFTGWTVNGTPAGSANPLTITMEGDRTITANCVPAPRYTLSLSATAGGTASASPPSPTYAAGTTVTLTAAANADYTFANWTVDGVAAGNANTHTLIMNADHTVVANFVISDPIDPRFCDVSPSTPYYEAIAQLAGRGIIRGYANGCFGPDDTTLRAQMAALIARAMGWDAEDHGNRFPDRGSVDSNLWRNVGTLAFYDVARGYQDGTYKPTNPVLYAQTISFITRAMVAKGYWQLETVDNPGLYPNITIESGHRWDVLTYYKYAGAIPGTDPTATWGNWSQPSTRGWFAQALWQAFNPTR